MASRAPEAAGGHCHLPLCGAQRSCAAALFWAVILRISSMECLKREAACIYAIGLTKRALCSEPVEVPWLCGGRLLVMQ